MPARDTLHLVLSVFNTLGVLSCVAAIAYLWNTMMAWRANAPIDGSTKAEVHRLTGRMLQFERELLDMRALMTSQEQAAIQRDKDRHEVSLNILQASTAQLDQIKRLAGGVERLERQQRYINRRMEERPCVLNERENGNEPCPDDQDIDRAKSLELAEPPIKLPPLTEPPNKLPPGFGDEPDKDEEE